MGGSKSGCLYLVDLAGSERVKKSAVTGAELKEAQHINKLVHRVLRPYYVTRLSDVPLAATGQQ